MRCRDFSRTDQFTITRESFSSGPDNATEHNSEPKGNDDRVGGK